MKRLILTCGFFLRLCFLATGQPSPTKPAANIERMLPDRGPGLGLAVVTNRIAKDGKKVDYMIREKTARKGDSGWRFFGGGETDAYLGDPDNSTILSVNEVANFDSGILRFLTYPAGTEVGRNEKGTLVLLTPDVPKPSVFFLPPVEPGKVEVWSDWRFDVSERMLRRFDDGSLVVWRPGFTIFARGLQMKKTLPIETRIERLKKLMSKDATDFELAPAKGFQKMRYRLVEKRRAKPQASVYLFAFAETQEIHLTIYYDDSKDLKEIEKIWSTLAFAPRLAKPAEK